VKTIETITVKDKAIMRPFISKGLSFAALVTSN
jgi:hypothetical protein